MSGLARPAALGDENAWSMDDRGRVGLAWGRAWGTKGCKTCVALEADTGTALNDAAAMDRGGAVIGSGADVVAVGAGAAAAAAVAADSLKHLYTWDSAAEPDSRAAWR
jgi:hypothetical protein